MLQQRPSVLHVLHASAKHAECVEFGQASQSGIPEAQSILLLIRNSCA